MLFFLDNRSTVVPADVLSPMAAAVQRTACRLADAWGLIAPAVVSGDAAPPGACRIVIVDDDPSKAGEYGDHSEENGLPVGCILAKTVLDGGGDVLAGGTVGVSVSSVVSHEVNETLLDAACNDWVFDGTLFRAKEASDPVEAVALVDDSGVLVSDAVLPAYFDAQASSGPYDLSAEIGAPFQLASGGYQIIFDPVEGKQSEIFGALRFMRPAGQGQILSVLKTHRFSRMSRRRRKVIRMQVRAGA